MDNPYFNPNEEVKVSTSGALPHWNQYGKIQYVTFRLADSLPQSKIAELTELKNRFISNHPKPWDKQDKYAYWKLIGPVESKLLDAGYGLCILKIPEIRGPQEDVQIIDLTVLIDVPQPFLVDPACIVKFFLLD